mgnify:CR=1 FL=1|tara:strand:- start:346002 stop:347696 length:1695 start_codon:yes stop_codon:yes gene_type:complete
MSEIKTEYDAVIAQLTVPGSPFELAGDQEQGFYYSNAPATLEQALQAGADHGDREFLVYEGERRSFSDLFNEADAIAAALQANGIVAGDRVALAMRNYPEWMAAFIGAVKAGAVIVPLNSWGSPADLAYSLADCGAKLVFCDQQRAQGIAAELDDSGPQIVIARPDDENDSRGMQGWLAGFAGKKPVTPDVKTDDLAMIMYTSGTSGKPKGAASTHRAICQALVNFDCTAAAAAMCNSDIIGAMLERGFESTSLLAVPLFHVSGCHAQFLVNLRGGRRIVMMYKWDVDRALDYVEQERVTTIAAAPAMLLDLLESPRFDAVDTRSLFALGIGGSATPPRVSRLVQDKVPSSFSGTGWGMTETNAQGASLAGKAFPYKPGSAGFTHPIVQIRICDERAEPLPQGETGEIWVRSPSNIREYWNRPDANREDFCDGWLKTGDIGFLDDEGFLHLADRAKDMILRGGENIYPAEIENELLEHEAIKDVAAIGLPHERLGEEVGVAVYLHPGMALDEEGLNAFASERLAAYKRPTRILFSDEPLPRNATRKILKKDIRARWLEQLGQAG